MAATATRTNEQPGTRAQHRYARFSATKARAVLDLIRGVPVHEAAEVLQFTERGPSVAIGKVLASAIANAEHNDELDGDSLYVSACYADEGPTLKRWRPRARGRATRIRKRTCHITIIVSPMPDEMAARVEARQAAAGAAAPTGRRGRRAQESRRARVARSRGEAVAPEADEATVDAEEPEGPEVEEVTDEATEAGGEPTDEMVEEAAEEETPESDEPEAEEPEAESDEPETTDTAADEGDEPSGDAEEKK
jgi:large subunit ribosomal protein L22